MADDTMDGKENAMADDTVYCWVCNRTDYTMKISITATGASFNDSTLFTVPKDTKCNIDWDGDAIQVTLADGQPVIISNEYPAPLQKGVSIDTTISASELISIEMPDSVPQSQAYVSRPSVNNVKCGG